MRPSRKRWSQQVTKHSNALDLEPAVFKGSPRNVAASLKRSAERSTRRKAPPYRSALSMLTFYINRAGSQLSPARKRSLERAKQELKRLFGHLADRAPRHVRPTPRRIARARRVVRAPRVH